MTRFKQSEMGFYQGIVWSAAWLANYHGMETVAKDMLKNASLSANEIALADNFDLQTLRNHKVIDSKNNII